VKVGISARSGRLPLVTNVHGSTATDLPVIDDRTEAPRDLRTRSELAARGFSLLGPPLALLRAEAGLEPLFSTSEARRLKGDTWPRAVRQAPLGYEAPAPLDAHRPGPPEAGGRSARAAGTEAGAAPGRPRPTRPQAAALLGRPERAVGRPDDPQRWLADLFREGFVVLDTETTGLTTRDEIIEIAAIHSSGTVLLETKVWPHSGSVPSAATRVHGYTIDDLRGAPTWPDVLGALERAVEGRRVFAWNAPFDERMVAQSARRWHLPNAVTGFECAMRAYSTTRGLGGSLRLERAAQVEGVLVQRQSHTSLDDARLTLAVLQRLRRAAAGKA
jgi:DNA polymerase-3 subunit epsilon